MCIRDSPETKQQSSQWKSPHSPWPKKAHQVHSNVTSMLIVFFFLTSRELSTRKLSLLVKQSMGSYLVKFWSSYVRALGATSTKFEEQQQGSPPWQCARAHIVSFTAFFGFKKTVVMIPILFLSILFAWPYPVRLFLFPKIKLHLKGRRFDTSWLRASRPSRRRCFQRLCLPTSSDAWTVSYTHLDVYKRQLQTCC